MTLDITNKREDLIKKFRNRAGFQIMFILHSGLEVGRALDHLSAAAEDLHVALKETEADSPSAIPVSPLGYEHAITVGWAKHNARRHELLEAKRSRSLSESEITELAELQWLAGIKRELQKGPNGLDISVESYYCPEHRYNPPPNSGLALCPRCEIIAGNWGRE